MNVQSSVVRLNAQGEHIARFHDQLRKLGYGLDAAESAMSLFGNRTRQRVIEFQTKSNLPPTGIVDERTAAAINFAADQVRDEQAMSTELRQKDEISSPGRP